MNRIYLKHDRVLILPGPYTSNLTYGYVGTLTEDEPVNDIFRVLLESAGGGWAGRIAMVHRSQLCTIGEATAAVLAAREAEGETP